MRRLLSIICVMILLLAFSSCGKTANSVSGNNVVPVRTDEYNTAKQELGDRTLYWSKFGKVYHTHKDCSALGTNDPITEGTLDQAIAANVTRLCKFCAEKDGITAPE